MSNQQSSDAFKANKQQTTLTRHLDMRDQDVGASSTWANEFNARIEDALRHPKHVCPIGPEHQDELVCMR